MTERNTAIAQERRRGATCKEIAARTGLSRQRIHQIERLVECNARRRERHRYWRGVIDDVLATAEAKLPDFQRRLAALEHDLDGLFAQIDAIPVDELELPTRGRTFCERNKITTLGELLAWSSQDLMRELNMGRKTVAEVVRMISDLGLDLNDG